MSAIEISPSEGVSCRDACPRVYLVYKVAVKPPDFMSFRVIRELIEVVGRVVVVITCHHAVRVCRLRRRFRCGDVRCFE